MLSLTQLSICPSPWIVNGHAGVLFKKVPQQIATAALFNFLPCIFSTLCIPKQFLPEVVNSRPNILFSGMNNLNVHFDMTNLDKGSVGIKISEY